MARLYERYKNEIAPGLEAKFKYGNPMAIPKLEKIVVSMGVGKSIMEPKRLESAVEELSLITGQKASITKARLSVAGFKLREGMDIGCKVTLRRRRMYEFLDRLVNVAIPRIRDFRGMSSKLDRWGNYNLGLAEQSIFPEINPDKMPYVQGMNIAIVTTAKTDEEAREFFWS